MRQHLTKYGWVFITNRRLTFDTKSEMALWRFQALGAMTDVDFKARIWWGVSLYVHAQIKLDIRPPLFECKTTNSKVRNDVTGQPRCSDGALGADGVRITIGRT